MREIWKLLRLTLSQKKRLVIALVSSVFVALFTFVYINLIQPIVDWMFLAKEFDPNQNMLTKIFFQHVYKDREQMIWLIPVCLVAVMFGKGVFTFISSYYMKSIGLKVVKDMRDDLFERLVFQSSDFFDRVSTGELLSRVTNDVDKIQEAVSGNMGEFFRNLLILFTLLVVVFMKSWRLALMSFVVAPLAVLPIILISRYLRKKSRQNQERMAVLYRLLHESITGQKIVKAFTMEKFELKKFGRATSDYLRTNMKLILIGSISSPFMEFIGSLMGAFILAVGASQIAKGVISPGDFSVFLMALFMMYMPIRTISRSNNIIQQGVACYDRVNELLKEIPQIMDAPGAYPIPPVRGHVRFEHVSFCYANEIPVLDDIDISIEPHDLVAIVGLSGSGKTTLVNLISRFYDPTKGRVTIDGIDIQEVTLKSLRSQIGLVTQELILFNDTVINNIAYGLEEIPFKRIIKAAKAAEAHEFIREMPEGYDSIIGEGGGLLSSGQRQRLAIARALLKDPPILILDEATSALDTESEKLIQAALANVMKDRTTIVIAHRLSTIRNADNILVVDKGRIVESGTHRQLLKKGGIYRKLYALQFPEGQEFET
ncbi:MAG: ATP-binding cassette domain-containing protein [Acidobacteria bacterium]|nr:ATP-binding cassette domain-containing protein [Acidobacteriota bacterium]MBU1473255.1 ATP-binding cassette domain-containing protein [Acidobacteriota bacterium]MBU2438152.1 ATP-binding cassette domain-containing protein [Acidobacteriota bacterium]